jgi:hypothetical protein
MALRRLTLTLAVAVLVALVALGAGAGAHLVVRVGGPEHATGQGETLSLSLAVVNAGDV